MSNLVPKMYPIDIQRILFFPKSGLEPRLLGSHTDVPYRLLNQSGDPSPRENREYLT